MHWSEQDISANGLSLHLYRTGSDKPPVVLAHGITDNGLCWSRLARALETDYDLIMLDARGHGRSSRADSYLPEAHRKDMIAVIEALELQAPALLGHSMGAVNASQVAAARPDLVGCLLLEDPPWAAAPQSIQRDEDAWRQALTVQQTQPLEALIETEKLAHPQWDEQVFPAWAEAKHQVDPEVVTWLDGGNTLSSWREIIGNVTCPTLLLTGDGDVRVTPEVAEEAKQLCSSLELAPIANAGHSIRRDQFDAYLRAVKTFLEKHVWVLSGLVFEGHVSLTG